MDDLIESAWLKWAWAIVDAEVLKDNVLVFATQTNTENVFTTTQHYDAKHRCIILKVDQTLTFPALWGLLLGDIVHNYRCCLDHLAWAIYKRGRTPNLSDERERKVYFPIYSKRTAFNRGLKTKLPGARRADIAIVRKVQPYHAGERRQAKHVLTVLEDLSNHDKHRTLRPVIPVPEGGKYTVLSTIDCTITRLTPNTGLGLFEPGAELARIYVRRTGPNPHIEVQPKLVLQPRVQERLSLQEWLEKTMKATAWLLFQFAEPPQSARNILEASAHKPSPPRRPELKQEQPPLR